MKTTIEVADGLLEEARARARREDKSLREVIEAALRDYLTKQGQPRKFRLVDRSVPGKGSVVGDDWKSVRAAIYDGRGE